MVDTLRPDYLGCYGFKGDISPNIDRFAKESIIFSRCIAQAPWTKPSVASFFTSLHPQTHRVTDHLGMHWKKVSQKSKSSVLPEEAVTMAEALAAAGYDTIGFTGNDFLLRRFGFGQGFHRYYEPRPNSDVFSASPLLNKALRLIKNGEVKKPFLMFFLFMDVHGPYQCEGADFDVMAECQSLGEDRWLTKEEWKKVPGELGRRVSWKKSSKARHVKNWRACYAAGVRKFDRRLKSFLEGLRKMNLMENSIVVSTADHGEELFDHGGWAHSHTLYSELLKVPLIIRMPGGIGGGRMVNETVTLNDLMPTLLRQGGSPIRKGEMDGRDISSYLMGNARLGPAWAYGTATRHHPGMISVQNGRYKLIWNFPKGTPKMFDLFSDPQEKRNISEEKPSVTQAYIKNIIQHLQYLEEKGSLSEEIIDIPDQLADKLKGLGYLR